MNLKQRNPLHADFTTRPLVRGGRGMCAALAATLAATLVAAPGAHALTVGTGDKPDLAVDAAGTAYVAWNGPENAGVVPLRFCRIASAASVCDAAGATAIAIPGTTIDRPNVVVTGQRVVVLAFRYGGDVPGFRALYAATSTDRGNTFAPARVVGIAPLNEAAVGPGDTISGLPAGFYKGMLFQNIPLDGSNAGPVTGADLSTTHFAYGAVGMINPSTPLALLQDLGGGTMIRRYDGSGDLNDAANWTPSVNTGPVGAYPKLAGGPAGLFLSAIAADGKMIVRKFNGTTFGAPVNLGNRSGAGHHLFQDAAGRLHATWARPGPTGLDLVHAVSDGGTSWRIGTVATQGIADGDFGGPRIAAAADHVGRVVWGTGSRQVRLASVGPDAPIASTTPGSRRPAAKPKPTFMASGFARRSGRRVRIRVTGQLVLPTGVSEARACRGTLKVSVRRGRRTITSKTVPVRRSCGFTFRATVSRAKVKRSKKLAVRLRFNGNDVLAAITKTGSIKVTK